MWPEVFQRYHRVGLLVTADRHGPAARAGAAAVRRSLTSAGHAVVDLPGGKAAPVRALVVNDCASSDLDGVASVRISTVAGGWRAEVE